jgi:O-methyltransferase
LKKGWSEENVNAKLIVNKALLKLGYQITNLSSKPRDVSDTDWKTYCEVRPYTMTSSARVLAAIQAARYVAANRIPGAIVECGVWRGGSSMAMAKTLSSLGETSREFFLYDTFAGMSAPTDYDRDSTGTPASVYLQDESSEHWARSPLEEVRRNMDSCYPSHNVRLVQGKVEETIPKTIPDSIAILRLDTDWYESTAHELTHLWPRLVTGGVLIIDDYGDWKGARKAVDEYFGDSVLLSRIDHTGRMTVKL